MKHSYLRWIGIILFINFFQYTSAQKILITIQGQVIDTKTKKPVNKVNIFLSGTTIGTSTDAKGKYTIQDSVPSGNYSLVFSHINYEVATKGLSVTDQGTLELNLELKRLESGLNEVTVSAKKDKTWKKQFKRFREEFLGTSSMAKNCKIVNPWVVNFQEKNDSLYASASKELEIENPALGYKIYCNLKNFANVSFNTNYLGLYRFEALKPKSKKQERKWQKARTKAFMGSFQHFACALLYKRLSKEGFFLSYSDQSPATTPDIETKPLKGEQIIVNDKIVFSKYLKITYSERESNEYIQWITKQNRAINPIKRANLAISKSSWVKIRGKELKISDLGIILDDPTKVQSFGYWAWQRVGNMLPSDFFPEELMQAIKLSQVQTVKQLYTYTKRRPQEKVYLHQDKSFYFTGDTLWMSGYVVDAQTHKPSDLSKVLYVELIDENQQIQKQLHLRVDAGKAAGRFIMEDFLGVGKYRLRAYTKRMADADPSYFFNQFFEIGGTGKNPTSVKLTYENKKTTNQSAVKYAVKLSDSQTAKLAGKKVEIVVKTGNKTYKKSVLKTDAQGNIQGEIAVPTTEKAPYLEVIAQSPKSADKKTRFSKSFFIPINRHRDIIRFFPEGGELIAGFTNQVAFKAINAQGWGVDIKGHIVDDKGNKVVDFQSMHIGMGKCSFKPDKKRSYSAIITQANGVEQKIALPTVKENGFILHINNDSEDFLAITLRSTISKKQNVSLIGHSRGKPVYTFSGELQKKKSFTLKIAKNTLPAGIVLFTLFDKAFQPHCERLAFINKTEQLQINLETNKDSFKPREKVEIKFQVNSRKFDTIPTALSLAIVNDEFSIPVANQTNILSNLLLTSDLKGFIENPGFYFKNKKKETRQALDLLMMTQGWRKFTWAKVLKDNKKTPKINIEQGLTISGKLTTKSGKPVANGIVTVLAPQVNLVQTTVSDEKGRFAFKNLILFNFSKGIIKATNAKGKPNVKVVLDKNHQSLEVDIYQPHNQFIAHKNGQSSTIEQYQAKLIKKKEVLEEVTVTAKKKPKKLTKRRTGQLHESPTHRLNMEDVTSYGANNLLDYLQNKLPGVKVTQAQHAEVDGNGNFVNGTAQPMILIRNSNSSFVGLVSPSDSTREGGSPQANIEPLYLLDGTPVDIFTLLNLPIQNIAQVDVLSSTRAVIYGAAARNGVIAVYTKLGRGYIPPSRPSSRKGLLNFVFSEGYNQSRAFYVPPYHQEKFRKQNLPDDRTTLYWNPHVQVKKGEAKVSFYTADNPGRYKIIVEGLSKEGEIARKEMYFEVSKKQ
ncbi:hypothetical protein BKI52_42745 [marine bacterium AO1-C]|nr:hypothetical protein BKI52_42745 [marine bacterium AO1-C]